MPRGDGDMNRRVITHEPLKSRSEYKRTYRANGKLRDVEVSRKDIENIISNKIVWNTTKWLCEQQEHGCARFDFTVYAIATKISKMVLTNKEIAQAEEESVGFFQKKPREFLSTETMEQIKKYVYRCWKEFEQYNMVSFTKVRYKRSFKVGRRRRKTYTYKETAVKLTDKGKKVNV
jgi:hypothetical protein